MKVLVTFEKEISFAISRNELENLNTSRRHKTLFILKCILFGFLYCSAFISCVAHLLTETKSFQEAADTFYWLLTMGACFIYFLFIWNGRKIFALIDRFESTIDERKLYFWKILHFKSYNFFSIPYYESVDFIYLFDFEFYLTLHSVWIRSIGNVKSLNII